MSLVKRDVAHAESGDGTARNSTMSGIGSQRFHFISP
jgi:hypothetical protein